MLPAIAAHAITTYTQPGDLVLDPMCGIGTALVEAVHADRHAVSVEYEPPSVQLARRNLHHARAQGATGTGTSSTTTPDSSLTARPRPDRPGRAGPPLTPVRGVAAGPGHRQAGRDVVKCDCRYSRYPDNLAHVSLDRPLDGMVDILTARILLLRPGTIVALTVRPDWSQSADRPTRPAPPPR